MTVRSYKDNFESIMKTIWILLIENEYIYWNLDIQVEII
jgi:hypothetical protein